MAAHQPSQSSEPNQPILTREEVYRLIDGEREFQIAKWGHVKQGVAHYVLVLICELQEAIEAWAKTGDETAVLDEIRQVAAVAVACLERHGCPPREGQP